MFICSTLNSKATQIVKKKCDGFTKLAKRRGCAWEPYAKELQLTRNFTKFAKITNMTTNAKKKKKKKQKKNRL